MTGKNDTVAGHLGHSCRSSAPGGLPTVPGAREEYQERAGRCPFTVRAKRVTWVRPTPNSRAIVAGLAPASRAARTSRS